MIDTLSKKGAKSDRESPGLPRDRGDIKHKRGRGGTTPLSPKHTFPFFPKGYIPPFTGGEER